MENNTDNRQTEQKKIYDNLVCGKDKRVKDFYIYVYDCISKIHKLKTPDKVFSNVMQKKLSTYLTREMHGQIIKPKVEEYIVYIAKKLTELTPVLVQWKSGNSWGLPMIESVDGTMVLDLDKIENIWIQTVKQWWEEDSFPAINEGRGNNGKKVLSLTYEKRDIALFFVMALDFTVDESDRFFEELSLVKDNDLVRPLYALDFKECLFRWILLWNENHQQKISYEEACTYYGKYGAWLLKEMNRRVPQIAAGIDIYLLCMENLISKMKNQEDIKKYKKELTEFQEQKLRCIEILHSISEQELYDQTHAENLKRLIALTSHLERRLERKNQYLINGIEDKYWDGRLLELKKYNNNTRMNRGTECAWSELSRFADENQKNFSESFNRFKERSVYYIDEAHWSQFTKLNLLLIKGEISNTNMQLVEEPNKKIDGDEFSLLKEALGSFGERNISFSYDGQEIQTIMKHYSNARVILSSLKKPTRIQDMEHFENRRRSTSSGISQMLNAYHKWCIGKSGSKGPHAEFKRDKVLKVALAAGIESCEEMRSVLKLSGKGEFQYLDRHEALVYLMMNYSETLLEKHEEIRALVKRIIDYGISTTSAWNRWIDLQKAVDSLPKEFDLSVPKKVAEAMRKQVIPANERLQLTNELSAWEKQEVYYAFENHRYSVIDRLRKADFLMILYYITRRKSQKIEEIRKKMFYGPYVNDFITKESKVGVAEERDWMRVISRLYDVMGQTFTEDAIMILFSAGYSTLEENRISGIINYEDEEIGEYCLSMEDVLSDILIEKEKIDMIKNTEEEIQKNLRDFSKVVGQSAFMNQKIPAVESQYILEQWTCIIAALKYYEIEVSEAENALNEELRRWKQRYKAVEEIHG